MKKLFLLIQIALCLPVMANAQSDSNPLTTAVSKLKELLNNRPSEKAYLHFDKPFYAAGDTLYFQAYVTAGEDHRLSEISGVLHVDLIDAAGKINQAIKLPLDSGITHGDFALPDTLLPGNFHVRAYTLWMKNDGTPAFFDKIVAIGSAKYKPVVYERGKTGKLTGAKPDIQFFPEGGYLVKGIRSKIAFKAVGTDGKGIEAKGIITDNTNAEVGHFIAAHLGMGSFYFLPEDGKTYKATVTFANAGETTVDLPSAEDKGMVLAVDNRRPDTLYAGIFANKAYFEQNKGKTVGLAIYSGGETSIVNSTLDHPQLIVHLPKSTLKTGVAQVTLFNVNGEPLNERLVFIQSPGDQLNISVQSNKSSYKPRENVRLDISSDFKYVKTPGHFSVSVIDEGKVPIDENDETTILSYLLLSSDLKGYIEQPNFYFTDTTAYGRNSLDMLMLTQGYRRFSWKQVLANNYPPAAFQPEKSLEFNGQVTGLFGKPLAKGIISLIPQPSGPVLTAIVGDKGLFKFQNLAFADSAHFILSAVNAKGRNATKIIWFEEKEEPVAPVNQYPKPVMTDSVMSPYISNANQEQSELIKYGHLKGISLKQVTIKDKKRDDQYRTQSLIGAGHADVVMHADEIERIGGPLVNSLEGRLHGVGFIAGVAYLRSPPGNGPMMVFVDGAEMVPLGGHAFDVNSIPSSQIETIEVLKAGNASIYGEGANNGVLIITTKQGGGRNIKDVASIGVLPVTAIGFYKAREFYSPHYTPAMESRQQRDFRSTLFWKPGLVTNKDGHASIAYYNADAVGTYKIIVEGIDHDGHLGRAVYRYVVGN